MIFADGITLLNVHNCTRYDMADLEQMHLSTGLAISEHQLAPELKVRIYEIDPDNKGFYQVEIIK